MFFRTPDDLTNLDISNGQCVNTTFRQNVTFSYQGLPFGLSDDEANDSAGATITAPVSMVYWSALVLLVAMCASV